MPGQDTLPALIGALASALAQGRSDEELALLSALFSQLGDSLAMILALRAGTNTGAGSDQS